MARTTQNDGRRNTGRGLPTDITQFSNPRLPDPAKSLIVALCDLITIRPGTLVDLIRQAMAAPDKPAWAVGDPSNAAHVRSAKSAASKFLGRAATAPPDWPTVAWIVGACVDAEHQEPLLARLAGRWCEATGLAWPPGHTGRLLRGDQSRTITTPEDAPDDATKARLLEQQLAELRSQLEAAAQREKLLTDLLEASDQRALMLSDCLGHVGKRIGQMEAKDREQPRLSYATYLAVSRGEDPAAQVASLTDRMDELVDKARIAEQRAAELQHHLAIVIAHLVTSQRSSSHGPTAALDSASVLPVLGLGLDPELLTLLDPPAGITRLSHTAAWLAMYLRTVLIAAHGHQVAEAIPTVSSEVSALVESARLPSRAVLREITRVHPLLRAYGPALLQKVLAEDRILAEAPTIPLARAAGGTLRPVSPNPAGYFRPSMTPAQTGRVVPDRRQVTVAELLALHDRHGDMYLQPLRRRRRRWDLDDADAMAASYSPAALKESVTRAGREDPLREVCRPVPEPVPVRHKPSGRVWRSRD